MKLRLIEQACGCSKTQGDVLVSPAGTLNRHVQLFAFVMELQFSTAWSSKSVAALRYEVQAESRCVLLFAAGTRLERFCRADQAPTR